MRSRWFGFGVVAVLAACGGSGATHPLPDRPVAGQPVTTSSTVAATVKGDTRIVRAVNDCIALEHLNGAYVAALMDDIGDQGATITYTAKSDFTQLGCILSGLGMTDFVASQIDGTRALDGQKSASWDGFDAVWTYSPDDGLTISIHDTK